MNLRHGTRRRTFHFVTSTLSYTVAMAEMFPQLVNFKCCTRVVFCSFYLSALFMFLDFIFKHLLKLIIQQYLQNTIERYDSPYIRNNTTLQQKLSQILSGVNNLKPWPTPKSFSYSRIYLFVSREGLNTTRRTLSFTLLSLCKLDTRLWAENHWGLF